MGKLRCFLIICNMYVKGDTLIIDLLMLTNCLCLLSLSVGSLQNERCLNSFLSLLLVHPGQNIFLAFFHFIGFCGNFPNIRDGNDFTATFSFSQKLLGCKLVHQFFSICCDDPLLIVNIWLHQLNSHQNFFHFFPKEVVMMDKKFCTCQVHFSYLI